MINMLIMYYVYKHDTLKLTGVEATNKQFFRMLLSGKRVHEVGKPGPAAACQKQFPEILSNKTHLENSSLFNYY
jgi:hypothetical protein